jgi:hypothetical protein
VRRGSSRNAETPLEWEPRVQIALRRDMFAKSLRRSALEEGICGGAQPAEFGVLLGSGVVKSASFVWLRTSLTERGARGDIRACEATPREEGLEAGVASV